MTDDLARALDECLSAVSHGESIEQCLNRYPELREQLATLLKTASLVISVPKVVPSEDFRRRSRAHVISVISKGSYTGQQIGKVRQTTARSWWRLESAPVLLRLVPVMLVVLLVIGLWLVMPPGSARASQFTLSVLHGSTDVQAVGTSTWQTSTDGQMFSAGSRVRTSGDSYAVLTFVDGSTAKLDSDTDVVVTTSRYKGGVSATVIIEQKSGRVWNHVQSSEPVAPTYEVNTTTAQVLASGTSFITEIDQAGVTTVTAIEGTVSVHGGNQQVNLNQNEKTTVRPGAGPTAVSNLSDVSNELIVETNTSAVGSVRDPSGSSTGYLPNGLSFNQITNSKNSLTEAGQIIQVTEPMPGEYSVIVRSLSTEPSVVTIKTKIDGQTITAYNDSLAGGTDWIITINLSGNTAKTTQAILTVQPLGTQKVENVVETKIALNRAVPIGTTATKPAQSNTSITTKSTSSSTSSNEVKTTTTQTAIPSIVTPTTTTSTVKPTTSTTTVPGTATPTDENPPNTSTTPTSPTNISPTTSATTEPKTK